MGEYGAASLLNPQRFESKGIADHEFLLRRPRDELKSLVEAGAVGGGCFDDADFDAIWDEASALFADGLELVSLDAFLYIYSQHIEHRIHLKTAGSALLKSMSSPAL